MNQIAPAVTLAVLLLSSAGVPALADEPAAVHPTAGETAAVQKKIDAAMKSAKSFVVTTRYPDGAYASTLVVVAPDRARLAVAIDANTTDIVTVGTTSYSSKNGAPFVKAAIVSPAGEPAPNPAGNVKVGEIHADVTVDGITYGVFDSTIALGAPVTLKCSYDKQTFRLARCANDAVTRTYDGYDDPKNVVELPKDFVVAPTGEK